MALMEDAASVLEQFVHDVANLPAEVAHLLEEIQAKDRLVQDCRDVIAKRDASIQKFVKLNGGHVKNPQDEAYSKVIAANYDKARILQEEKVGLSEKAGILLDRHIKRLDIKIRDLQNEGQMPVDLSIPSLLRESSGNIIPPTSLGSTGVSTPLHPLSSVGGTANIANAAIARMANSASGRTNSPANSGMQTHLALNAPHLANSAAINALNRTQRESSVSSDTKRRRLNASLGTMPATSSNLARQSSLGPGTPKAGTPASRAGSAGPSRPGKKGATTTNRKVAPHQQQQNMRKKVARGGIPKKSARRLLNQNRVSPSTTGDDESVISGTGSASPSPSAHGHDGTADDPHHHKSIESEGMDAEGEDDDTTKYCICNSVSYGDMVACDNENCPYQWFHWNCIGITEEPVGDWLCSHCKKLPKDKIRKAR